jgi:two-component system response regulator FixJ
MESILQKTRQIRFIGGTRGFEDAARLVSGGPNTLDHFASCADFLASASNLNAAPVIVDNSADDGGPAGIASLQCNAAVLSVIAIVPRGNVGAAVAAMHAGASDVLTRPLTKRGLEGVLAQAFVHRPSTDVAGRLSNREREVLDGLAQGLTNKLIGIKLGISHRTVEIHRAHLMRKLGAQTLSDVLAIAFDRGGAPAGQRYGSVPISAS